MDKVISKDGIAIAFQRSGSGPLLILVHGTASDHTRWAPDLFHREVLGFLREAN